MKTFLPEFNNEIYCDINGNFALAITAAVHQSGTFVVYMDMTATYAPYLMPMLDFLQKYEIVNHEPEKGDL